MKILAFDTSSFGVSIALNQGETNIARITTEDNKQSEVLISKFEEILNQNKIWYQDLEAIAAISGPGSFTGVRVGLSAARALKLATNLPLILISSLEVLAFKYRHYQGHIFVAIDAKMDEFFVGSFYSQDGEIREICEAKLATIDNIYDFLPQEKFLLCGNGKEAVFKLIDRNNCECDFDQKDQIDASLVAELADKKIVSQEINQSLEAFYIRDPKITARKATKKRSEEKSGGRGRNRTDA